MGTFIFFGFIAIIVFPYAAAFIFCVIIGMIGTVIEKLKNLITFKKSTHHIATFENKSPVIGTITSREQIRSEAAKIFLNRIEADEDTKFH